jgi:hypothetical protein
LTRRIIVSVFLAFFASASFAQDAGNDEDVRQVIYSPYRISIRGNGLIPHPVANGAFRRSFNGIYDATFSVNLELVKGLNVGLMYKNSGFQTPADKIAQLNTKQQYNVAGARLGYDYFMSKVSVFSAAINVGQCYITSSDIIPLKTTHVIVPNSQGLYMEPELSLSFYTDDNFAIGFNLSYEIIAVEFNPYDLGLDQHSITYSDSDLKGFTQNISIGFHFVYAFLKKKKK